MVFGILKLQGMTADVVVTAWLQSQESSFGPVCCKGSGPRPVKPGTVVLMIQKVLHQ